MEKIFLPVRAALDFAIYVQKNCRNEVGSHKFESCPRHIGPTFGTRIPHRVETRVAMDGSHCQVCILVPVNWILGARCHVEHFNAFIAVT